MNRPLEIIAFLTGSGWENAEQLPLAADFSSRRYARLLQPGGASAILMDADPDQKTPQFVMVAGLLRACDLSAPQIFKADAAHGLVLMEDFGGTTLGQLLDSGAEAKPLYYRAVDVLAALHKNFDLGAVADWALPCFTAELFNAQAGLFLDHYVPHKRGEPASDGLRQDFTAALAELLQPLDALPRSLLLRDYMPDNLMNLPARSGARSLGLLDFQDAGIGPIAYDIASLVEVVRRDGGGELFDEMVGYYHIQAQPPVALADLRNACIVLSAQRHLRILGILSRLQQQGRRDKVAMLPRVETYLQRLITRPALRPLSILLAAIL